MSLFANKFPQSQNATRENRNHFPPSGVPWIYERRRAIYSSAWQKKKWVCISTQLYTSDGVEMWRILWIFILRTQRKQWICLADHWVDMNPPPFVLSSVVQLVLKQSLPPSPFRFKVLSLFWARTVCVRWKCLYLTQIIRMSFLTASILETIHWLRNGEKKKKKHWLKHQISKAQSVIVCVCVCV